MASVQDLMPIESDPLDVCLRKETRREVIEAVHSLPEPLGRILYLHFVRQWTYREIGEEFDKYAQWASDQTKKGLIHVRAKVAMRSPYNASYIRDPYESVERIRRGHFTWDALECPTCKEAVLDVPRNRDAIQAILDTHGFYYAKRTLRNMLRAFHYER